MARNPFEETARSGGRPGYQSPTNYRGESPQFSRGLLDVRYPVDSAVQEAHRRPSNRQPLLNQPPMAGPSQRPHVNPRMRHINTRQMRQPTPPRDIAWHDIHPYTWNRMMHGPEFQGTTTPYGYKQPDEYGRMRPTLPNPYEGATIGGGWDDDYRTMEELKRKNSGWWDQQIVPPSGIETLDEQAGLWQDIKRILKNTKNPGPLIDQWTDHWNEQQTADVSGIMDKFTDKFGDIDVSGEGIEYEKGFDIPWGGTGTIEGQYGDDGLGGGIKFSWPLGKVAQMGGLGSTNEYQTAYNVGDTYPLGGLGRKRPYGDTRDMGPKYRELETIPLDQQFDQWGNPTGSDDFGYFDEEFVGLG